MTPAARYAAAIEILGEIFTGAPAERVLTGWSRGHRFAGSKDRAAIRDHVFDVLRARRTLSALGGAEDDARAAVLGLLRRDGIAPETVFGAGGYAPAALTEAEAAAEFLPQTEAARADLPEWLWPEWQASLGEAAFAVADLQRQRAPVTVRVNLSEVSRDEAAVRLGAEGIDTAPVDLVEAALRIVSNPRRLATSETYRAGLVELQDAASQAAVARLVPLARGRVLDYCAGGGGKALALADRTDAAIFVHDVDPARMADLPARAARAGVRLSALATKAVAQAAPFDLVLCDAPCSGSGTWRRTPDAKWRLTSARLAELQSLQSEILAKAVPLVRPGGHLAYATCSVLRGENGSRVAELRAAHPELVEIDRMQLSPAPENDGFYLSVLRKH